MRINLQITQIVSRLINRLRTNFSFSIFNFHFPIIQHLRIFATMKTSKDISHSAFDAAVHGSRWFQEKISQSEAYTKRNASAVLPRIFPFLQQNTKITGLSFRF